MVLWYNMSMGKKVRGSLFSPGTIFLIQWGDTRLMQVRKPNIKYTNKKDKACGELRITDYYIPIKP